MVVIRAAELNKHKFWQGFCDNERMGLMNKVLGTPSSPASPGPYKSAVRREPPGWTAAPPRDDPLKPLSPEVDISELLFPVPARSAWFPKGAPNFQNNNSARTAKTVAGLRGAGELRTTYVANFGKSARSGPARFRPEDFGRSVSLPNVHAPSSCGSGSACGRRSAASAGRPCSEGRREGSAAREPSSAVCRASSQVRNELKEIHNLGEEALKEGRRGAAAHQLEAVREVGCGTILRRRREAEEPSRRAESSHPGSGRS